MIPAACRLAPWPSSYAMTGRLLRRPSLPTRGPTFDRKNVVQLRMCTASAGPGGGRPFRVCFDWGRKRIFGNFFRLSLEIWRGLNLASCLRRGVSHFRADKLYLDSSVKFPKNMGSSPIDMFDKIPHSRGSGSELGLPHLLPFFHSSTAPRAAPPLGCTSARSQAPPTGPGYDVKLSSRSAAPAEHPVAAASTGKSAVGLEPRGKFGPAQRVGGTQSI